MDSTFLRKECLLCHSVIPLNFPCTSKTNCPYNFWVSCDLYTVVYKILILQCRSISCDLKHVLQFQKDMNLVIAGSLSFEISIHLKLVICITCNQKNELAIPQTHTCIFHAQKTQRTQKCDFRSSSFILTTAVPFLSLKNKSSAQSNSHLKLILWRPFILVFQQSLGATLP